MRLFWSIIFLSFFKLSAAQEGCTDTQALNYSPNAVINDGSCLYPDTQYDLEFVSSFTDTLKEISGSAFYQNSLYCINDGNMENLLFQIDTHGVLLKSMRIEGIRNIDWEGITIGDSCIFIGDFGNNTGNRRDLRILNIPMAALGDTISDYEVLSYQYADQVDFTARYNDNDYDCEAFFLLNDTLHLFSKNWRNNFTKHYILNPDLTEQSAILVDSFFAEGLITSAAINEEGVIALLAYDDAGNGFAWLLSDYPAHQFFRGNKRKVAFNNVLLLSQLEGMTFSSAAQGYITGESIGFAPPKLHKFDFQNLLPILTSLSGYEKGLSFTVYPNPALDVLHLQLPTSYSESDIRSLSIFDLQGRLKASYNGDEYLSMDVSFLSAGFYTLQLLTKRGKYNYSIFLQ